MAGAPEAQSWGIPAGYHEIDGTWRASDPDTVAAILAAMRAEGRRPAPAGVRCLPLGTRARVSQPSELQTEDGARLAVQDRLPAGLPAGYHLLRRLSDGDETRLIVSPRRCRLPRRPRAWGWAVQLYAVRSASSWGFGDLGDLARLARWSRGLGAGALLLNPLHSAVPVTPLEPSPYFPSSRRFRNPLFIRLDGEPPAAARRLNQARLIGRDQVWRLKGRALEARWKSFGGDPAFERYRSEQGQGLQDYATFCAISERHGTPWSDWPEGLRHPRSPQVTRFRSAHPARVGFHEWLQWLLDRQLAAAAGEIDLIHDLAVGVQAGGADSWAWQDILARGIAVGAPPDPFQAAGQDWGLPPFDPWRLRAAGYQPFIDTLRAAFRHGAGLRIDHVMGLFRLFWIPAGRGPATGAYVNYPASDLLDILALESSRAGAYVVGEDLGTVEDRVRSELARRRVMSYKVMLFEDRPPSSYPRDAMAAMSTHDLPTLAGLLAGNGESELGGRLRAHAGIQPGMSLEDAIERAYAVLAGSPCRLLMATLEDALGVAEQPNKPGTTDSWPNWSLALPGGLEGLESEERPRRLAATLRSSRVRGPGRP